LSKTKTIFSEKTGYVHHLAVDEIHSLKSEICAASDENGFALLKKCGDPVDMGEGLIRVFVDKEDIKVQWEAKFRKTFTILSDPPEFQPFILERSELRLLPNE
jgi:thymidine phosphorylase